MCFKIFLFAVVMVLPFASFAEENSIVLNKERGPGDTEYGIMTQDSVKKKAATAQKPQSKKPDTRSIQEKIRDARSAIKQVPRSVPKLKPQPVKEKVNIRSSSPGSVKKGAKRVPF